MALAFVPLALASCEMEQPARESRVDAAVATVRRALQFDSESEGRRICRRVFTQTFMEDASRLDDDDEAIIVCRLTRLSRQARGRVVNAAATGRHVRVRIRYGGKAGTATVIRTNRGWQVDSATDGAVTALIGVKE